MKKFDPWHNADGTLHMIELPNGNWVRWADHKARIREMEDEIADAKATAHERGYYQGKVAGRAFGAAMREHVIRLEAERDEAVNQLDSCRHTNDVWERRAADFKAERDKLRGALDKLASAAIPIFTDEAGLVHFDAHPRSIDLWDATTDARVALAETEDKTND